MRTRLRPVSTWLAAIAAGCLTLSSAVQGQPDPPSPTSKTNLAQAAEVSVSGEQDGLPKGQAVDGNRSTQWASTGGNPWIALHWKEPLQVGRLVLHDRADPESTAQGGKVLFSDGSTLDVDDIPPGGAPCEVRFRPRTVSWLRLDLFSALGKNPGLAEIQVYSDGEEPPKPSASYPAPGTLVTVRGDDPRIVTVDGVREGNVPLWLDAAGEPMQCHMGGVMFCQGRYYLVGGDWRGKKLPGFRFDWCKNQGMVVYSSPDLMNWTCHGNFCGASSDPHHPLYDYTVAAGRAKLLPARGTGKFVALFQVVDNSFSEINVTAAAVADNPEGPYAWHGILQFDGKPVQGADTAVFTDDDGSQYLITGKRASDWNVADCLNQLSPDCLSVVKAKVLGTGGEAPAIFKHDGVYFLLHSHLTGLSVNDNFYHTATDIWGPWEAKGNIAQGDHSGKTFMTQTTDVVPVAGKKGAFIWIGDSIRNDAKSTTRTVWLPVTIKNRGEMEIRWRDSWDLSVFGN